MATFYIQLENKLLQISGELTAENIFKAIGYVPADSSALDNYATKDEVSDLVDMSMVEELAQRVDNISFDNLKDNPFLLDGSGELNIVDESGNIIAKVDSEGIHSIDFVAGDHKLSDKADKSEIPSLDGYATESWVEDKNYLTEHQDISHLATKEEVADVDFFDIKNNPITNAEEGNLIFVDESGNIGLKLDSDNNLTVKDVIAGDNILSNKVDKENGKGLSTEDFTTALKNKLQSLSNYDDTSITEDVNSLRADFDTLVSGDTSTAIKTFNEIIAFLEGVEDTESLSGIIASIEQQIANIEIPSLDGYATEDYVNQKEQAIQTWVNNKEFATQEDVANIDFYSIKDNPIINDGDGKLIFADENGNIGLQLEADNTLYVKDVIAGDNILSNKADKSDLEGLATEQWVTDKNYLTQHQDISHLASIEYVDEQIANVDVTEQLKDYALKSELPVNVSELNNDKGYLTEHQDISHLATKDELDNKDFYEINNNPIINDGDGKLLFVDESGNIGLQLEIDNTLYVKDVIAGDNILSNKADKSELGGLATEKYVDDKFSSIEIPDVDFTGLATEQWVEDKNYLTEHQDISHLATKEEIPSLEGYAKTEDIPSVDGLVKSEDLPNFDEFAKTEDIPSLDGYATEQWVNNKNYATEDDLNNIDYSTINNVPVSEDETGELNITDESGNIGMKVASEAVYAKDFVAGDHRLSEKVDKTYVDNLELDELNAVLVDTDSVADDPIVPDYVTESELETALSSKMDKVTLAKIATSGNYNDLTNKPTIPSAVTESTVSGWGFTKNTGTYSKPSSGIPKSDLDSAVQTSLVKADTALQSHQDISGKQDKLVSGTNIKTINGTSILGSGNIVISGDGGSSSGGSGVYSEVNHGTSDTTFTLTPNTFHVWDEVASLTLDLGSETIGVANEFLFQFTSGATATSLTLPDDIKWANNTPPTIVENMIYQVSIMKGLASVLEFSNESQLLSFMANNHIYYAEVGMSWRQFVDSIYNISTNEYGIPDFGIDNDIITFMTGGGMSGTVQLNNADVLPDSLIIETAQYDITINVGGFD